MALSPVAAAYNLDESSGNPADSSGNGYTLTNNGTTTFGTGLINNCATFGTSNTTKSFSRTGTFTGISAGGDWSLSFWFRTTTTGVINCPLQFIYGGGTYQIDFIYDGANTRWFIGTGAFGTTSTPAHSISSNTWYNIVLVNSSNTITWYENNSSQGTIANNTTSGKTDAIAMGGPNAWYNQGDLDMVYLFPYALDSSERASLYNSGVGIQYPFSAGSTFAPRMSLLGVGR